MNHIFSRILGCLALLSFCALAHGEDIYVAQTALGADTGLDAANAHSKAWIDNAANWGTGTGKVGASDTVHLVGTITSGLTIQASGTFGSPITVYFEPGAKISTPNSDLMYIVNRSYLVVDGGTNGILENTNNGTDKTYKTVTRGINASGVSNVTIKNLTIRNLYVHTSVADSSIDFTTGGGIYANGYGANVLIQNCSFSDMCWCIIMFGSDGGLLTVNRCTFTNYDHGIGGVACGSSGTVAGFVATNNHFGTTANWDTTANSYHHDGIHTFWGNGSGGIPKAVIMGNLFDGNWGINNTAHLFFEQNYNTHASSEASGWTIANNVHIQYPGNLLNNGFLNFSGDNAIVANNTYIGASIPLSSGIGIGGTGTNFKNNLIYGVNRCLDLTNVASGGLNNNLYVNIVGSGNTPFRYNGANVASLSAWQTATGQDAAAQQLTSIAISTNGSLPIGSAAIGAGTNLSASFTIDKNGATRRSIGTWDVGAYEYGAISTASAPSCATTSSISN